MHSIFVENYYYLKITAIIFIFNKIVNITIVKIEIIIIISSMKVNECKITKVIIIIIIKIIIMAIIHFTSIVKNLIKKR